MERRTIAAAVPLVAGLLVIPAFALQTNLVIRVTQSLLFVALATAKGGRFRPLPLLLIGGTIVAVHLIFPSGRVLSTIGEFALTLGALELGLTKAFLIIGLVYLSRFTVEKHVPIPGRIGEFLSAVFEYFEAITERRGRITRAVQKRRFSLSGLVSRLDDVMIEVFESADEEPGTRVSSPPRERPEPPDGPEPQESEAVSESAAKLPGRPLPRSSIRSITGYVLFVAINWAAFAADAMGLVPGFGRLVGM